MQARREQREHQDVREQHDRIGPGDTGTTASSAASPPRRRKDGAGSGGCNVRGHAFPRAGGEQAQGRSTSTTAMTMNSIASVSSE